MWDIQKPMGIPSVFFNWMICSCLCGALVGCGLSNAPTRSFLDGEHGSNDGLRGQEWMPEVVPQLKAGSGTPVDGFDFEIRTQGAQRVVRGHNLIFSIQIVPKLGSLTGRPVTYAASGLPFEMKVRFPVLEAEGSPNTQAEAAEHFAILKIPENASRGLVQLRISAGIGGLTRTAEHTFRIEPQLREIPTFASTSTIPAIPYLDAFRKKVENSGATHCPSGPLSPASDGIWTWDGLRAYELSLKIFNIPRFVSCAETLRTFLESQLKSQAFPQNRIFTLGLESSQLRNPRTETTEALRRAAENFVNLRPQANQVLKSSLAMLAMISAARQKTAPVLPSNPWVLSESESLDLFLGHWDQILISQNAPAPLSLGEIGLLAEVLIELASVRQDSRIAHYLWVGLERLWNANWNEQKVGFIASFPNPPTKSVDLNQNLALAGAYAWLYQVSGAPRWMDRADALFEGGVRFGSTDDPALYSAQLRFAYDYLKWRGIKPRTDSSRVF